MRLAGSSREMDSINIHKVTKLLKGIAKDLSKNKHFDQIALYWSTDLPLPVPKERDGADEGERHADGLRSEQGGP
jgi:hypothetical protein